MATSYIFVVLNDDVPLVASMMNDIDPSTATWSICSPHSMFYDSKPWCDTKHKVPANFHHYLIVNNDNTAVNVKLTIMPKFPNVGQVTK